MGLHKRHLVGRAFHADQARALLAAHKRDSHGSDIRLHVPEGFENKAVSNDNVQTAVSVVYVTLSQTFSGPASYVTMTGSSSTTPAAIAQTLAQTSEPADTTASLNPDEASYASAKSAANAVTTATLASVATTASSSLVATSDVAAVVGGTPLSNSRVASATAIAGTPLQATHTASSTAGAIEQNGTGMSGGAQAGLAIGIILALGLAFGLLFFCWRRKKNTKDHEEILDEKHASFVGARRVETEQINNRSSVMSEKVAPSIRSTRTTSTAPRLSLRPVTQFLPNLGGAVAASEKPKSAWERRPDNTTENPFDDAPVLSEKEARPASNPFEEANGAKKHSPKASLEGTEPPTPKSTKFGTAAAVSVAAAGAANAVAPPRGPNNVHRVQLDFKPSMEDELELRSGQLVRMLHEYDDGWALCMRMDRSQQGVAPRTCLSKLPVKPRPQGPPPQGARPGTAGSHVSNSSSSSNGSGRRPSNPQGGMVPRPLTPTQASREQSPASPTSPTSVPARKPVPGQAM